MPREKTDPLHRKAIRLMRMKIEKAMADPKRKTKKFPLGRGQWRIFTFIYIEDKGYWPFATYAEGLAKSAGYDTRLEAGEHIGDYELWARKPRRK
jgi:hypothetical protein